MSNLSRRVGQTRNDWLDRARARYRRTTRRRMTRRTARLAGRQRQREETVAGEGRTPQSQGPGGGTLAQSWSSEGGMGDERGGSRTAQELEAEWGGLPE